MTVRLKTLASRKSTMTAKELGQLRKWLDDDWESHDVDRDMVKLVERLSLTLRVQ